jgi:hypothetical protein
MMYCFRRSDAPVGRSWREPGTRDPRASAQMRGDMMLASTRLYISSGKMKISMSESVTADEPPAPDPYHVREEQPPERGRRDRPRGKGRRDERRDTSGRDRRPVERERRKPGAPRRRDRPEARPPPLPQEERLPFMISFVPEQNHLATMVSDIRTARHAFPLPEVAHRFLNTPDWHLVKFEAHKRPGGTYAAKLFQSRFSGVLFVDRTEAVKQVAQEAMTQLFTQETVQKDPPAGNFVCIARCRLTGVLLGPPNYHGYNERVDEIHRTRFSRMTLDEYRRNIETVHDPELIERWKEEVRTFTVYRLKKGGDGNEPWDASQAMAFVQDKVVPARVAEVARVVLPGRVSREIRDPRLLRLLRAAWTREQRSPATLMRALRGAFRRMGLFLFKTKGDHTFVTVIQPRPIAPDQVVETIREVLLWLKAHPGCSRHDLVRGLRPEAGEDPAKLGEVLQPLTWLIDRGHVIEFYDGTLATPKDAV